jgi:hypothetical protein
MPEPLIQQNQIIPLLSPNCTLATVGTAAAAVVAANPTRRGLSFSNPSSTATIYLAPLGVALSAGLGVPLLPGATQAFQAGGNFQINCGWQAVASAASSPLTILEFV